MSKTNNHLSCVDFVKNIARGSAVGAADLVPGVSGSTLALLLGIYPTLIRNLALFSDCATYGLTGKWRAAGQTLRTIDWPFLCALGCGVLLALLLLAPLLSWLLRDYSAYLFAVFFGMTIAVILTISRTVQQDMRTKNSQQKQNITLIVLALLGVSVGVALSLLSLSGVNQTPSILLLCIAAACAICAMLLPGISGSFVLLLFGAYQPIIHAISTYEFNTILPVVATMMLSALCFLRLLRWLLLHYYHQLLILFAGLLTGGLFALWPWSKIEVLFYTQHLALFLFICGGCVAVLSINRLSRNSHETV